MLSGNTLRYVKSVIYTSFSTFEEFVTVDPWYPSYLEIFADPNFFHFRGFTFDTQWYRGIPIKFFSANQIHLCCFAIFTFCFTKIGFWNQLIHRESPPL